MLTLERSLEIVVRCRPVGGILWLRDGRVDFGTFRRSCLSLVDRLEALGGEALSGRLEAARDRLAAERLTLLVVGEFSRGKSTFINALIGQPVLPSKVNPTTARINVLRGGSPAVDTVHYADGREEALDLPAVKINRFLDSVVTTANEAAASIRIVDITLPGRLERLAADIVDTPGVNDLDAAREEVTFGYLRRADAALVLLDAQQPLSESERAFLREKVMGSDINRLVFVLNKVDEVLYSGGLDDVERIRQYVISRLIEECGVAKPEVHAVAAKNALRARYKGTEDPTPISFDDFETRLIEFAGHQATAGRLQVHLDRLEGFVFDERVAAEKEGRAHQLTVAESDKAMAALRRREELLRARMSQLDDRLERLGGRVGDSVARVATAMVGEMRSKLDATLASAETLDDLEDFRGVLARELRALVTGVESAAVDARRKAATELGHDFEGLLGEEAGTALARRRSSTLLDEYSTTEGPSDHVAIADHDQDGSDPAEFAVHAGLGFAAGALFGPIGVAAAVLGGMFLSKAKAQERAAEAARRERDATRERLRVTCDKLMHRAAGLAKELADREAENLAVSVRERGEASIREIHREHDALRRAQSVPADAAREQLGVLRGKLDDLAGVARDVEQLRRECANA